MKNKTGITIRKSCITGKAVWIYQNPYSTGLRMAYHRACKKEEERVRRWGDTVAKRKANIQRLLGDLMAKIPVTGSLSAEKRAAARMLASLAENPPVCYNGFYEHILEERRRRNA